MMGNDEKDDMFSLAKQLRSLGSIEHAVKALEAAIEEAPRDGQRWMELGECLVLLDDLHQAMKAFQQVVELDEGNALAWLNLGLAFHDEGRHLDAVQALQEAVSLLDPASGGGKSNLAEALFTMALSRHSLGDARGAFGAWEKAIEIAVPVHPEYTWKIVAASLQARGDEKSAIVALKRAASNDPEDHDALFRLGGLQLRLGNADEAIKSLMKAIELDSNPIYEAILARAVASKREAGSLFPT